MSGLTVWLTGLPSAGKSTLAHAAADRLVASGHRVQVLDGDQVRPYLSAGLGFSKADRDTNVTRIGWVARLLAAHQVVTLVPVIAPYASARAAVRADHDQHGVGYAEVYVSTPVEVTSVRDVKGLYAQQAAGRISGLTGVDDPYEAPADPDLEIDTVQTDLTAGVEQIVQLVRSRVGTDRQPDDRGADDLGADDLGAADLGSRGVGVTV